MNNKEAIEEIKSMGLIIDAATSGTRRKSIYEALTLAIKALENKRPIDDLSEYSDKLWQLAYERGKAEARPQGEWIPVSERLPDKEGEYLVTRADFDSWGVCRVSNVIDIAKFDTKSSHNNGFHKAYEVLAWMPLPESYKEAEND